MTTPTRKLCEICGSRSDVRAYKTVDQCRRCRAGIKALEKEDGWFFDPESRKWVNPNPKEAYLLEWEADAAALLEGLQAVLSDLPVQVEPPDPAHGMTRVILPDGKRWHIYPRHQHQGEYSMRLWSEQITPLRFGAADILVCPLTQELDIALGICRLAVQSSL